MKKNFFLIIIFLFSMSSAAQSAMKIVYFENYPPFSWKENNQMKGILIDVLTESIQNQMGIQISHKGYPWARAQMLVKDNKADAFVTVPTPERKKYTKASTEPVILVTFTLFIPKQSIQIDALKSVKTSSDLKNFNLIHYVGSGWAKQNLKNMNVYWVPTLDKVLYLLTRNNRNVFVDASQVVRYNIKRLGYQAQITELSQIIDSASFNLCIGNNSSYVNILPKFNTTIKTMKANGKLQEIYHKYE